MLALLQWDAASVPLLERMLDEGSLPNLEGLRRRGRWERLVPPNPVFLSATYPTLYTGVTVEEHGLYTTFPWSARDQRVRYMHQLPKPPTVWDRLSDKGRRSLVIDPYHVWHPREISGVFISGWQFRDRMVSRAHAQPRRRGRALSSRYGRSPELSDVYGTPRASALLALCEHLVRGPARAANAACDLIGTQNFDLAWINFGSAHRAGHLLWDPLALIEEELSDDDERRLRHGLEKVYSAVDEALGRILETLPEEADVIVFSPFGMGPNTSRSDLLPAMVELILADGEGSDSGADRNGRGVRAPVWGLRARTPVSLRNWIARVLPDGVVADITARLSMRADWGRTRAMAIPGENHGYVRLNLKGRERDGIVDRVEADDLLSVVAEGLMSFNDPNGSASIKSVERRADLIPSGSCAEQLPDLVVCWSDRSANELSGVSSARFGQVDRRGVGSGRTGHHNDDAWALLLPGATTPSDPGRPPNLTDISATACELLGADSEGLSGRPLLEANGAGR